MTVTAYSEPYGPGFHPITIDGKRFLASDAVSASALMAAVGRDTTYLFFRQRPEHDEPLQATDRVVIADGDEFYGVPPWSGGSPMTAGPRGTPSPLDLRAVEARLNWWKNVADYGDAERVKLSCDDVQALLALLRETRLALKIAAGTLRNAAQEIRHPQRALEAVDEAAAVLAAAQDGPA